jgi:hypothetical protein
MAARAGGGGGGGGGLFAGGGGAGGRRPGAGGAAARQADQVAGVVALLKDRAVQRGEHRVVTRDMVVAACDEVGGRIGPDSMLQRLNGAGVLLQVNGSTYRVMGG